MTLADFTYWCPALEQQSSLLVTLPQEIRAPLPVVYLLHGLSDNYAGWQRYTNVERYAERHQVMVVMPDGGRSFYCDSVLGRWEQHILAAVDFVDRVLPTIKERTGRGISGSSMGGYGAMKIGLKHPERFASVVAHSSCFELTYDPTRPGAPREIEILYTGGIPPADDCYDLARRAAERGEATPALHLDCGIDDLTIAQNRRFHAHLDALGIAHEYLEHPGGHDWDYWDRHLDAALRFHRRCFDAASTSAL